MFMKKVHFGAMWGAAPLNLVSDGTESTSDFKPREEEKNQRSEPRPDKGHNYIIMNEKSRDRETERRRHRQRQSKRGLERDKGET